jgi:hypothetical protein
VNTASEQAEVIGTIEAALESLESGAQKRKISKSRTNRGR